MTYYLSDKHTTGDAGLSVEAETVEMLFEDSAYGLMDIIAEPEKIEDRQEEMIELEADDLEQLYFAWLSELIYIKDADDFLVKRCRVEIVKRGKYNLKAQLGGEKIDRKRHILKIDVKAVTFYNFRIEEKDNRWQSEVVFDL
jgi:SHS2 domain-containing protein